MSCEYCEDGTLIFNGDHTQVWLSALSTLLALEKESDSIDEANINFCPMCGSKLGDSDDYDRPIPASEMRKRISEYCSECGLLEWLQGEAS